MVRKSIAANAHNLYTERGQAAWKIMSITILTLILLENDFQNKYEKHT